MIKTAGELITQAQNQVDCVNPVKAKALYDDSNNAVILDVREANSYDKSSLNHSINIPRGLIEMLIEKNCQNSETLILTHCAGGGRASLAALTLQQMGYSNVHAITATFKEIKDLFD
jgi:rhodanese-related sulfurtransferase